MSQTDYNNPPNIGALTGKRWQHTGNGHVYVVTGVAWDSDTDQWKVTYLREATELERAGTPYAAGAVHGKVHVRSVASFVGDRDNGVPRYIPARPVWSVEMGERGVKDMRDPGRPVKDMRVDAFRNLGRNAPPEPDRGLGGAGDPVDALAKHLAERATPPHERDLHMLSQGPASRRET